MRQLRSALDLLGFIAGTVRQTGNQTGNQTLGQRSGRRLGSTLVLAAALASALTSASAWSPAGAENLQNPFVIGNFPVQAAAQNAVAAKEKALADGQRAAFRSLVKRLVPVTDYKALAKLRSIRAAELLEGISVRSERNSSTSYTASLDFAFDAKRVRDSLTSAGIAFVDEQAAVTAVVPVYIPPPAGGAPALAAAAGDNLWRNAWNGLDLQHALTPVELHRAPAALTADVVKAALKDPGAPLRAIAALSRSGQALLAIAEADPAAKRLHVTLSGTDAAGSIVLRRSWRLDTGDPAYSAEFAAVIALATIEGRWKATRRATSVALPPQGATLEAVQLFIEYRSLNEWQALQKRIASTPGVKDFVIAGLSARGADAALRYPGGGQQLATALASQGVSLRNSGGTWYARAGN